MGVADYDNWLTTDPADRDYCQEHQRELPCFLCQYAHLEDIADANREMGLPEDGDYGDK